MAGDRGAPRGCSSDETGCRGSAGAYHGGLVVEVPGSKQALGLQGAAVLRGGVNSSGNLQPRGVGGAGVDRCGLEARSSAKVLPALPDQRLSDRRFRSQGVWLIRSAAR